ncbi:MAG: LacI family DNA-binding transcriptional regulator [Lachnospiraceae bacterium]|nr:LacI family DNA-binding transcriptional regulator [Lachnospiraceae bacterium]
MNTRPTIKDIAAEVGVTPSTVSYVLNGNTKHRISEQRRQDILDAAKRLNYIPNEAARSLRYNTSNSISVALEKPVTQTRFSSILQGIRNHLSREGYQLVLFDFSIGDAEYPAYLESVLRRRTDGIIYISSTGEDPDPRWRSAIISNSLPFVACDCCPPEESLASVSFDYERGAYEIACRLYGEGAKRILFWRPDVHTLQEHYREKALKKAASLYPGTSLEIHLLPYREIDGSVPEERRNVIERICRQHLMQEILPHILKYEPGDAIVCSQGVMAKNLCSVLSTKNCGLTVACLSDASVPILANPRVLTSRPRYLFGGDVCAKLLLQQIRGESIKDRRIQIEPEPPSYVAL